LTRAKRFVREDLIKQQRKTLGQKLQKLDDQKVKSCAWLSCDKLKA